MLTESCIASITSEEYSNYIIEKNIFTDSYLASDPNICSQSLGPAFIAVYVPTSSRVPLSLNNTPYATIPKLFGIMDTTAVNAVNSQQLSNLSTLGLKGQGTIVGFIDTGIDYTHSAFKTSTGQTRITCIWDQTIPSTSPNSLSSAAYGTLFSRSQINTAINSTSPYMYVPSRDTNGHGTFLAGVCAGSENKEDDFTGIASESEIAVVKLKEAKNYLREYFLVPQDALCYQEDDIMSGINFLVEYASLVSKPLVICIGLGTSQGSHTGNSPLISLINSYSLKTGIAICIATGNEGDSRKHFEGMVSPNEDYQNVELRVSNANKGFSLEMWGEAPDIFSIGILSPSGEFLERIPARLGQTETYNFIFDNTTITIDYSLVENYSGRELILIRFFTPTEGIWTIRVFSKNTLNGKYNIWLPISAFLNENTYFLTPDPDTTLTSPSDGIYAMSVAAYNHYNNSLYLSSGRGFSAIGAIRPDFAAPGVNVFGPALNNSYTRKSGTSISAAITAGVAAQFMTWGIEQQNAPTLNGLSIKNYLIRGAKREASITYPNKNTGYGLLDAFNSFDILRND